MCFNKTGHKARTFTADSTSNPSQSSRPQYAYIRHRQADGRVNESVRVVIQEMERENGDIERRYGHLPLTAGAVQDVYIIKKKELRYDGLSSTKGKTRVRRKKKFASPESSESSTRGTETDSNLTRTEGTGNSNQTDIVTTASTFVSRKCQNGPVQVSVKGQPSSSQARPDATDAARTNSNTLHRLGQVKSKVQTTTTPVQKCAGPIKHQTSKLTASPSIVNSKLSTSGLPHECMTSAFAFGLIEPSRSDSSDAGADHLGGSTHIFQQPGMTPRQSEAFVFDGLPSISCIDPPSLVANAQSAQYNTTAQHNNAPDFTSNLQYPEEEAASLQMTHA